MTSCTCPACDHTAVKPLARELWQPGQRVAWVYHAPGNAPVYGAGVIIPREQAVPGITEGISIKPDNPLTDTFWAWDFEVSGGLGNGSPIFAEGEWKP